MPTPPIPPSDPSGADDANPHALAVASLKQRRPTRFSIQPDAAERAQLAQTLGFDEIRKLRFEGEVAPRGKRDWTLKGQLGATIVQPCVVTLAPVVTRIDADTSRLFLARPEDVPASGSETEMPEDDTQEALGDFIDPYQVMLESLSLEAPDFPRADPDAALGSLNVTEPDKAALTDDDVKPFADLAELRARMTASDRSPEEPEK